MCLRVLILLVAVATRSAAEFPPTEAPADVRAALDPATVDGQVFEIEGPPSTQRDTDRESNSAAAAERVLGPRRDLLDGVDQRVRRNWLAEQFPDATSEEIARRVSERYTELIAAHLAESKVISITVEPGTLRYPISYAGNSAPINVQYRRLTRQAQDESGQSRCLVAYDVNCDRVDSAHPLRLADGADTTATCAPPARDTGDTPGSRSSAALGKHRTGCRHPDADRCGL